MTNKADCLPHAHIPTHILIHTYTHTSQPCCGVFVFTLFCESCFRFPTRLETSAKNVSHIVNYFERKMMMMSVPAEIVIYEWQNIHRSAVPFAFRLLPACHGLFVKYDLIYWVWPPRFPKTNGPDNMQLCVPAYLDESN